VASNVCNIAARPPSLRILSFISRSLGNHLRSKPGIAGCLALHPLLLPSDMRFPVAGLQLCNQECLLVQHALLASPVRLDCAPVSFTRCLVARAGLIIFERPHDFGHHCLVLVLLWRAERESATHAQALSGLCCLVINCLFTLLGLQWFLLAWISTFIGSSHV
jgi:hypothetical protein